MSHRINEELCAALARRSGPHQALRASAAHNPALLIRGIVSPLLANLYLHYVLSTCGPSGGRSKLRARRWDHRAVRGRFHRGVRGLARGRGAAGGAWPRFAKLGLQLDAGKTRVIEIGGFRRPGTGQAQGKVKAETYEVPAKDLTSDPRRTIRDGRGTIPECRRSSAPSTTGCGPSWIRQQVRRASTSLRESMKNSSPSLLRPGVEVRLQRGRVHRRLQCQGDALPLPRQQHPDPMDPDTDSQQRLTSGQDTRSARCGESRTAGAGGGSRETTGGDAGTAPAGLPHPGGRRGGREQPQQSRDGPALPDGPGAVSKTGRYTRGTGAVTPLDQAPARNPADMGWYAARSRSS